ncbi:protein kinase [Deltaproteobacteria bacterium TL4]
MLRHSSYLGKTLLNRYEIKGLLGEGGMGQVFLAWDRQARDEKAIKLIDIQKEKFPLETVLRFTKEAENLKTLQHPYIVSYKDFVHEDDIYLLVMEYLRAPTLLQYLQSHGPLTIKAVIHFIECLAETLLYVHEHGLVHHDLKASNIIIDHQTEDEFQIKLLDFGLSQLVSAIGNQGGTLAYMAPEQTGILRKIVDHRADLYSAGILIYETLVGQVPFRSEDSALLIHQHIAQTPEAPSLFRKDLPPSLEDMVLKLLRKDPDDRYRTTRGLLKDIQHLARLLKSQPSGEIKFELGDDDHWDSLPQEYPFIGRNQEIHQIETILERSKRTNTGGIAFLEGAPGVGKTRMLAELSNKLQAQGERVWHEQPRKEETDIPYKFFRSLMGKFVSYLKSVSEAEQYTIIQYCLKTYDYRFGLFLEIVPALSSWLENSFIQSFSHPEAWKDSDYRSVIIEFFKTVSHHKKHITIVIDDFQNLDSSSMKCLLEEFDSFQKIALTWVVSSSYEDIPLNFQKELNQYAQQGLIYRLHLAPLTEATFGELLQLLFSNKLHDLPQLLEPLYCATQGNPAYLKHLLQNLLDHRDIYYEGGFWQLNFEETLRCIKKSSTQEQDTIPLIAFSEVEQAILQRGAAFQRAFTCKALHRVLQAPPAMVTIDDTQLLSFLDKTIQHGVLSVDSEKLYAFRNYKLREILLRKMPLDLRQEVHRMIALFLEDVILPKAPESIYDIAHHWGKTGDPQRALEYYLRAAHLTSDGMFSNRQTQFYFNLAKDVLKKLPPSSLTSEKLFDLHYQAARHDFFLDHNFDLHWQQALELEQWVEGDKTRLMKLLAFKASLSFFLGNKKEMFRYGEEVQAMAVLPEDGRYVADVYNLLGRVASHKSYEERQELLSQGIELSLQFKAFHEVWGSVMIRSVLLGYLGRFNQAKTDLERTIKILKENQYRYAEGIRISALAYIETERGEFRTVLQLVEQLKETPVPLGALGKKTAKTILARAYGMQGMVSEALSLFDELLQKEGSYFQHVERPMALLGRIQMALQQEEPETALSYVEEARRQMEFRPDPYMQSFYAIQAAWAYLQLNQLDEAKQALDEAQQYAEPIHSPLLESHLTFAQTKWSWHKTRNRKSIEKANQILKAMLEMEVTGYYELYNDDLKTWSRSSSDSSSQLSSVLHGNTEMLKLLEINRKITGTLDTNALFEAVLEGSMQMVGAENGYLFTASSEKTEYTSASACLRVAMNAKGETIPPEKHGYSLGVLKEVLCQQKTVVTRDARNELQWQQSESIQRQQMRSILATPITLEGQTKGILYLDNRQATAVFSLKDKEVVDIFATQVAIAMRNAEIYEKEQQARRQTEATLKVFERFVPRQFTSRLLCCDSIEDLTAGMGQQSQMSVLFSDIRSFTSLTESMPPNDVFQFLNEYLLYMDAPIRQHRGFVDKFIGDAIMALFDQSPLDSIEAGLAMQEALKQYNQLRQQQGKVPLKIGIGIHTGEVTMGVIGSKERMDTTVLGDTVNIASRIESLTKYYQCTFLIGGELVKAIPSDHPLRLRRIDQVQVKGRQNSTWIYEIFNHDPEPQRELKLRYQGLFQQAFDSYQAGTWLRALSLFENYAKVVPEDYLVKVFIDRCQLFIKLPPENWNGIFRIEKK